MVIKSDIIALRYAISEIFQTGDQAVSCKAPERSKQKSSDTWTSIEKEWNTESDFLGKVNHPNIPGQTHVKFANGDEHEIPFPCNPTEIQANFLWVSFFLVNGRRDFLRR
jgi:hypothetical protein